MHRVVVAPDSFKGSIGAAAAAAAIAEGWRDVRPGDDIVLAPMADGGEGTIDAFAAAIPAARRVPVRVTGPDGSETDSAWLLLPQTGDEPATAIVELASTSGIELLGDRRLPWDAGTAGFGQAIAAALDHGVDRLVLGIGSSASTDGGIGMLAALGARFLDAGGRPVAAGLSGLAEVTDVDLSALRPLPPAGVTVLTDVTNPLAGPIGAAAVFGPQKGLDAEGVDAADAALTRLAALIAVGAPDKSAATPGAGAAGGAGFALLAWGAELVPGADAVADLIGLRAAIGAEDGWAAASLVITGEGSFDGQSAAGKAPTHVAALAREAGARVALVAGRLAEDADTSAFAASVSLSDLAGSPAAAMADPARWLRAAGERLARSTS